VSEAQAENLIRGPGTTLAQWQASPALARVPTISHEELVPQGRRLVVIAPHPDDEILGCAGILAGMQGREAEVLMIAVTDGEGSHPGSLQWTPERLRQARPVESAEALQRLGLDTQALHWQRLGAPDSGVPDEEIRLRTWLSSLLQPGDRVVTTWRHDGHCDHEATGRATADAVRQQRACLIEVPVWAWHWAQPQDPRIPWARARKLLLDPATLERKRQAISAHVSQVNADGPVAAVLSDEVIERLSQPFELVFI
jgi:LmbE family N-acetylglucosaminyl deacetylase